MHSLMKLIKLSYCVKINLYKCLKFDINKDEYKLAKYYEKLLNELDDNKVTNEQIDDIVEEIKVKHNSYEDRKEIADMLLANIDFLNHIKIMR